MFLKGWGGRKYESLKTPVWQANWFRASSYFSSRPLRPLSSWTLVIGQLRVPPGPLYQDEVKASAFDMEMIFHFRPNKTPFHKKGCALGLILKVRVFGTQKWSIVIQRLVMYALSMLDISSSPGVSFWFFFSLLLRCILICICIYTQVIIRLKNIYLYVAHFRFNYSLRSWWFLYLLFVK